MKHVLLDILVIAAVTGTIWYVYTTYSETIIEFLFGPQNQVVYIENLAVSVSVADSEEERRQGLSGVTELGELEGKLFVFDTPGELPIWMKDMLIPIDIIWISEEYKIVHIEERVDPSTYPATFRSPTPARFVLETNAFFVDSFKLAVGDEVTIPAGILPEDLKDRLLGI